MTRDPMAASLLILAGGRSSRMGQPKSFLNVGGGSLLAWSLARLGPSFGQILVSVADRGSPLPADLGKVEIVYDLHRGRGPLAGIEAGLASSRYDVTFVVACDMPQVTPAVAAVLIAASGGHDAAVPLLATGPEPLCAAYRASAGPELGLALREDRLQAREALAQLDVNYVDGLGAGLFANLNTPEDYRAFLAALR